MHRASSSFLLSTSDSLPPSSMTGLRTKAKRITRSVVSSAKRTVRVQQLASWHGTGLNCRPLRKAEIGTALWRVTVGRKRVTPESRRAVRAYAQYRGGLAALGLLALAACTGAQLRTPDRSVGLGNEAPSRNGDAGGGSGM